MISPKVHMATPQCFIPKDIIDELTKFKDSTVYVLMAHEEELPMEYKEVLGTYQTLELAIMEYLKFYGTDYYCILGNLYHTKNKPEDFLNRYDGQKWIYASRRDTAVNRDRHLTRPITDHMPYYIMEASFNSPCSLLEKVDHIAYVFIDDKLVKTTKEYLPAGSIREFKERIGDFQKHIMKNKFILNKDYAPPSFLALARFDFARFHHH